MNRIKTINLMNRPTKQDINNIMLLTYKAYLKRDNLSNSKCSKVETKILKSKKKSKKAIKEIQTKNIKLAMYGLY